MWQIVVSSLVLGSDMDNHDSLIPWLYKVLAAFCPCPIHDSRLDQGNATRTVCTPTCDAPQQHTCKAEYLGGGTSSLCALFLNEGEQTIKQRHCEVTAVSLGMLHDAFMDAYNFQSTKTRPLTLRWYQPAEGIHLPLKECDGFVHMHAVQIHDERVLDAKVGRLVGLEEGHSEGGSVVCQQAQQQPAHTCTVHSSTTHDAHKQQQSHMHLALHATHDT